MSVLAQWARTYQKDLWQSEFNSKHTYGRIATLHRPENADMFNVAGSTAHSAGTCKFHRMPCLHAVACVPLLLLLSCAVALPAAWHEGLQGAELELLFYGPTYISHQVCYAAKHCRDREWLCCWNCSAIMQDVKQKVPNDKQSSRPSKLSLLGT